MSKEILQNIIQEFSLEKFINFFRLKNKTLHFPNILLDYIDADNYFTNGIKLAKGNLDDGSLIVCSFLVNKELSERTSKKAQYNLGKKILKEEQSDAGIFIFYSQQGNFRFSLIYTNYSGKCRDWSNFKRFTYFVSSELTNKTFLTQIGESNFSTLEKIKEAFSVEKLTKEFFNEIANWYFWAVRNTNFPENVEKEENGRHIAIIRLITRIIFIWFMRKQGLIPPELFDFKEMSDLLNDLSDNQSTFYKAILQNLFFATLNTKNKERKFRFQKIFQGKNQDYMDHTVYRYEKYFKNKEKAISLFKDIPFLNGGLFDCLDRKLTENGKNKEIRIDGFTDREAGLNVPNFLFFSDEKNVDLNKEYGTKNKRYKFQGLINILSAYNFTIDENVPDDQEVALDPELLGKVFENLLASYNPETASTARKATGSYYTPREIVDYMVSESLKEYFKTHLKDIEGLTQKLDELFSTENKENPFAPQDTKRVIKLIDDLRIVDPAVGSGAFPMGVLTKLVLILSKLDTDNELWKETQLNALDKSITDPVLKNKLKEQTTKQFKEKNSDYGRKLYLIQKCIYGVDIQQIAVEIAKLRFFISLLVNEEIDKSKENWGIEPLPNLDFKIMQGNSLISEFMGINLDEEKKQNGNGLFEDETSKLIKDFQNKKNEFQNEPDKHKKDTLMQEINKLIIKIFEAKLKNQKASYFQKIKEIEEKYSNFSNEKQREELIEKEKESLYKKEGFNLGAAEKQLKEFTEGQKTKPFFAWKLYFAEVFQEKGGFDIVIGNPPYVRIYRDNIEKKFLEYLKINYKSAFKKFDLYVIFIEKGINLLNKNGFISLIVPDKWLTQPYGQMIRNFILTNCNVVLLMDLTAIKVFESSTVDNFVFLFKKEVSENLIKQNKIKIIKINNISEINNFSISKYIEIKQSVIKKNSPFLININQKGEKELIRKIESNSINLYKVCYVNWGCRPTPKKKFIANYKINEKYKSLIVGSNIFKYHITTNYRWVKYVKDMYNPMFKELFENITIVFKDIIGKGDLTAALNTLNYYSDFTVINVIKWKKVANLGLKQIKVFQDYTKYNYYDEKFILCIVNSRLESFYFNKTMRSGLHTLPNSVKNLLLPITSESKQKPFISIVDKILEITKDDDYLENPSKQANVKEYEHQIDQMVYQLYGLTEDEIKIIEKK